jgi:hypothetical protein
MVTKSGTRSLVRAGLVALAFAAAIGLVLRSVDRERERSDDGDQPLPTPVRVAVIDGRARVTVTPEDLAAGGIEVAAPEATSYQRQLPGLATVIAPQAMAAQKQVYQSAAAEATRAELAVKAARLEVERLAPLHQADRIVSDKALESARNDLAATEANAKAAIARLAAQRSALEGQWGPVLAKWLADGARPLERLLAGRDLLVRVSLPTGALARDPTAVHVQASLGVMLGARIISSVPQADPKFQGPSFFAALAQDARLMPGMTVPAAISLGAPVAGFLVPDSAILRWHGEQWVFVELAKGEFVRQQITNALATPDAWLVTSGLGAGTPIVVRGAQLLLSEEVKARPAGGDAR